MSKRNGGQAACKFNLLLKSNITPPYSHITTSQLPASVSQQLAVDCFIPVSFSLSFSQPYAACQLQSRLTAAIASSQFPSLYHTASHRCLMFHQNFLLSFMQMQPACHRLQNSFQQRLAASKHDAFVVDEVEVNTFYFLSTHLHFISKHSYFSHIGCRNLNSILYLFRSIKQQYDESNIEILKYNSNIL